MAQMVEVLSVQASEHKLPKPRVIPRPGDPATRKQPQQTEQQQAQQAAATHGGLLTAAAMRGMIVVTP